MTSVVIVDDQELVRSGLRLILDAEADLDVVGEAGTAESARALVAELRPDVVLMDVRMPGEDGITATRELVRSGVPSRILVLTTFDLDDYVFDALEAGASGFLLKDMAGEEIVAAVRASARGTDALLAPTLTKRLVQRFTRARPVDEADRRALDQLTTRERDVLHLIAEGLSNQEIAARLYIGETTVKTHVARVFAKTGARDRVQAVIYAHRVGIVGS